MLTAVPDLVRTLVAFAVVLGVLVFVHELGHYLAARWRGVKVETFSIGFGKAITSWTDRHDTVWKLAWLPLGGYVKMHGQERPEDVPDAIRRSWIPGKTFQEKSVLSRAIIVAAGPAANFLLAMVVFAALFVAFGKPIMRPVVGDVLPGSAAEQAGLKVHDRIVSIAGQKIDTFETLQRIVMANPSRTLPVTVERDGADVTASITPQSHEAAGKTVGVIGVRGGVVEYTPVSLPEALWSGVAQTWTVTSETVVGLTQIIGGTRNADELGGPLRIAQLSGQVAELGVSSLVTFIAVLSVNLGLINLFPIPVLDGGHLLFYLAEAIRGRPLPQRAQEYGFRAGMALLAGLFVFATWNDLTHLGLFHWVAGLIG
ncbi:MAG TPA: RIP metalloprotease RseP [Rhodopila sp.]|nr:RIP metalloprotease RseP [Rhodopila sp.]